MHYAHRACGRVSVLMVSGSVRISWKMSRKKIEGGVDAECRNPARADTPQRYDATLTLNPAASLAVFLSLSQCAHPSVAFSLSTKMLAEHIPASKKSVNKNARKRFKHTHLKQSEGIRNSVGKAKRPSERHNLLHRRARRCRQEQGNKERMKVQIYASGIRSRIPLPRVHASLQHLAIASNNASNLVCSLESQTSSQHQPH